MVFCYIWQEISVFLKSQSDRGKHKKENIKQQEEKVALNTNAI